MAKYIDADSFIEKLKVSKEYQEKYATFREVKMTEFFIESVKEQPTADVEEVKYGYWIKCQKLYGIGYEYVCSACEKGIRQYEGQPICSECGAKMDRGKAE